MRIGSSDLVVKPLLIATAFLAQIHRLNLLRRFLLIQFLIDVSEYFRHDAE